MADDIRQSNAGPPRADEDPHGHAALVLVESLIHGLIARSALTPQEALEVVNTATEVLEDFAAERCSTDMPFTTPLQLLNAISASLAHDA